jgi:hypothetical protein
VRIYDTTEATIQTNTQFDILRATRRTPYTAENQISCDASPKRNITNRN